MDRLARAALDTEVSRRELLAMLGVVPFVIFATEPSSHPATHRSTVATSPAPSATATSPTVAARTLPTVAGPTAGGAMQIVAHQDDDLLFQSPDLLHDVAAGRPVRTVFVTAGDAARDRTYWTGRERGSMAAYARMAGVADTWTSSDAGVPGTPIRMHTLVGAPHISLVFMRLPDGNRSGSGMMIHHHESLMRLWRGDILTIHAVDGTASYSAASLRHALTTLMSTFQPTTVRTQDWTIAFGTGDNADHTATALFVQQAHRDYDAAHTVIAYEGYPVWTRPPDVDGTDLTRKSRAFHAYAEDDAIMCLKPWCAGGLVSSLRLARQYITASESVGNVARDAGVRVTASSQTPLTGQTAARAIAGFAHDGARVFEQAWATDEGRAGSWIQLDFPAPTTINGVVLYGRPNPDDQITGATLLFSDGSTVPTGALAANGSATTLRFASRVTTSLRLTVTAVSPSTQNVGLAQLEAYGNMPQDATSP